MPVHMIVVEGYRRSKDCVGMENKATERAGISFKVVLQGRLLAN